MWWIKSPMRFYGGGVYMLPELLGYSRYSFYVSNNGEYFLYKIRDPLSSNQFRHFIVNIEPASLPITYTFTGHYSGTFHRSNIKFIELTDVSTDFSSHSMLYDNGGGLNLYSNKIINLIGYNYNLALSGPDWWQGTVPTAIGETQIYTPRGANYLTNSPISVTMDNFFLNPAVSAWRTTWTTTTGIVGEYTPYANATGMKAFGVAILLDIGTGATGSYTQIDVDYEKGFYTYSGYTRNVLSLYQSPNVWRIYRHLSASLIEQRVYWQYTGNLPLYSIDPNVTFTRMVEGTDPGLYNYNIVLKSNGRQTFPLQLISGESYKFKEYYITEAYLY